MKLVEIFEGEERTFNSEDIHPKLMSYSFKIKGMGSDAAFLSDFYSLIKSYGAGELLLDVTLLAQDLMKLILSLKPRLLQKEKMETALNFYFS
ncbi:MAG: hypothetical protein AABW50_05040 [Nanoarchaeota archaeon]